MKRYEKYKPSGIEWLGEIPEHWEVKRVKDSVVSPLKYGANEAAEDDNPLNPRYIRITDFSDNGLLKEETFKSLPHSIAKDYLLNEDDILFARSGATVGKTFIFKNYNGKACFAGYLIKVSLNKKIMTPSFLYFFSKSYSYDNWKNFINTESTIQNISAEKYNNLLLPFPSLSEQTAIANYLDTKTAAIDRKIELLTAKAANYKTLRRSLINETVCRGLNPNVSLKDSGIEWIGMIPEHWEVKRLKEVDTIIMGQSPNSDDYNFELKGYPFLQGNAEFGSISPTPSTWCEVASKTVVINDILVSVRAPIGAVNIADVKYGIGRGLCAIRAKKSYYKFLYYYFVSQNSFLQSIGTGTTYIAISMKDITNLLIAFPPHTEQNAIAVYLDDKTAQIDAILTNIGEQITKLTQLRKTLINDVVMGKIKVTE